MDGAFYIVQSAFFKQSTGLFALLAVLSARLAYYSGSGRLVALAGLAPGLGRPVLLAWGKAYLFNRGLVNGLVLVHPLLVALTYASLASLYLGALGLGGAHRPGLAARAGVCSGSLALALGAW